MPGPIHSPALAELLRLAFDEGAKACEDSGGFEFIVTTKGGAVFEGAPVAAGASDVGAVLALMSGCFIVADEIAALQVRELF